MSSPRRLSLSGFPHWVREQFADLPRQWRAWREGYREDPAAFWHGPIPRLGAFVIGGVILLVVVQWALSALVTSASRGTAVEATPWATLYVACTNPACRAHFTTQQAMNFAAWPLSCESCGQPTVYRAKRCAVCRAWYALRPGEPAACPICLERKARQERPVVPDTSQARTADDEDPW